MGGLWVYGWFELWLSRCRVEGVGVGGVRCRGVGVCGWSLWVEGVRLVGVGVYGSGCEGVFGWFLGVRGCLSSWRQGLGSKNLRVPCPIAGKLTAHQFNFSIAQ